MMTVRSKLTNESVSKRVLKISQHVAKLWARIWWLVFYSQCRC